ncbi:MAG: glycosyltransferase [Bacteroidota bacterium]
MLAEKIFFVIPSYNDFRKLPALSQSIKAQGCSCVIVDDGSSLPFPKLSPLDSIYLLRHKENLGQGAALQTGFEFALKQGAEVIVSFDADGQHQLEGKFKTRLQGGSLPQIFFVSQ